MVQIGAATLPFTLKQVISMLQGILIPLTFLTSLAGLRIVIEGTMTFM
jgi:hypothetical protein